MEPMFEALSLYRCRNYDKCIEKCTEILEKQPLDQAAWCLKMRALTQKVYVDDLETNEVEQDFLDENAVASTPRPGTSLKTSAPATSSVMSTRPRTATGRPISGIVRPGTQKSSHGMDRLKTARPIGTQSSRTIRLGTAAMITQKDGPFIEISRLNIAKYAKDPCLSKPLFEYLFYFEGDIRNSMELAVQATQFNDFKDWWWEVQLAKCYIGLNLVRNAEQKLRAALKIHHHVEIFVRLAKVYLKLDQPLSAAEICKNGLQVFPKDITLMTELARLYELLNESATSVKFYRSVVIEDAINNEAIACIGMYHFYNNQPELALRYYRRILAVGAHSAELYNNLGLCCLYSQQLDVTYSCFQRALDLAVDPLIKAEVWYNLSYVAIGAGDLKLAMQCLNLCLSCDSTHFSAMNNLGVLYYKMGKINFAKSYLSSAKRLESNLPEAQLNLEILESVKSEKDNF